MSIEAMSVVLHHSRATGTAKLVLVGIANHAGDGGAWPTLATLARYANVSERNVRKAIATLVELREVQVHVQGGGTAQFIDSRRPNLYVVLVTCPAWCDRTSNHRDIRQSPQPALWITGGSETTGEVEFDRGGGSDSTGGGGSPATPKPSIEPSINPASLPAQVQNVRAVEICGTCGQTREECDRRVAVSGHTFESKRRA